MKCIICGCNTKYYFTTNFNNYHNGYYKDLLDKSEYYRCINCGFTFSKTIYEMDYDKWCILNIKTHTDIENKVLDSRIVNQPPYIQQASMLNILIKDSILDGGGKF